MTNGATKFTLFEINKLVKEVLTKSLSESYWVIAEISEIIEHSSGHCYLELIQKDDEADTIKARAKANIWSYTYRMLKPYFESMTNRKLAKGMKVLVNAQIVFHELYGYSLNILDIEPSFTLGDIELKRRETINKLMTDGVMDMNKELELPMLPKRIAIISSPSAAGLQDFIDQLINNLYGYVFEFQIFPSTMQGDEAEKSILNSLNGIYEKISEFDIAVIVRGGGAQTDLSCFDSYALSSNIAQFPLPILTGIGHEKDVSVVDMVAHLSLKTPTAVAEYIISKFNDAENIASELASQLSNSVDDILSEEKDTLTNFQAKFQYYSTLLVEKNRYRVENLNNKIPFITNQTIKGKSDQLSTKQGRIVITANALINKLNSKISNNSVKIKSLIPQKVNSEKNKHNFWEQTVNYLNPYTILQKGYSITYYNGRVLKDSSTVKIGENVETKLKNGLIIGNIVRKEP